MSSIYGASFNFINSIVGAGIIGIPYAIHKCGFVTGIILLFLVAILVNKSVIILIECGIKHNKLDFEDLSLHLFGERGYIVALSIMFMFAYGAQIAYMVIIGDTIPAVAHELISPTSILANRTFIMAILAFVIILPLCILKDLSSLSWTSLLSIICGVIFICITIYSSPEAAIKQGIDTHGSITIIDSGVFAGIGTMSFAFVCQHNSFIVFRSLKEPTLENWRLVARYSVWISFVLCLAFGLGGYLSFGDYVKGDILNNFPEDNIPIGVARVLLAITMVFTYPMECFVARHCLMTIHNRWKQKKKKDNHPSSTMSIYNRIMSSIQSLWQSYVPIRPNDINSTHSIDSTSNHVVLTDIACTGSTVYNPTVANTHQPSESPIPVPPSTISNKVQTHKYSTEALLRRKMQSSHLEICANEEEENGVHHTDLTQGIEGSDHCEVVELFGDHYKRSDDSLIDMSQRYPDSGAGLSKDCDEQAMDGMNRNSYCSRDNFEHVLITLILWSTSVGLAILSNDLGMVLSLTGALAASLLGYVMPALIFIKTYEDSFRDATILLRRINTVNPPALFELMRKFKNFYIPMFMIIFGTLSLVIGVTTVFVQEEEDT